MKAKDRSLGYWIIRRIKTAPAQSMVEFAMALPVLLLATFGVVEFGRLLQAWLALENGARFGARYAVTGEYNKDYCAAADAALGLTTEDGNADCKVEAPANPTDAQKEAARDQTQALQDWARLPSIRDAALAGASGIAYAESASGDYETYLTHPEAHGTNIVAADRGNPSLPGFFMISICSNRILPVLPAVTPPTYPTYLIDDPKLDSSLAKYFPGQEGKDQFSYFPTVCERYNRVQDTPTTYHTVHQYLMDDAGGPGDRVRVTLTYRHNMIMPLLSDWWPTLRLNTSRDGVVEQFRTSRVTGLSEGNMNPDTPTFTPSNTPSLTASFTPTDTPIPCGATGNGIRAEYYNYPGTGVPSNPFSSPIVVQIEPQVNFNWGTSNPVAGVGVDYFAVRFVAQVMPEYTGDYTFYTKSDDGQRLWVNGSQLVDNWAAQSAHEASGVISLTRCTKYDLVMEYFELGGSASSVLSWESAGQAKQVIPQDHLYAVAGSASTATATRTNTPTFTQTLTLTQTISLTPTKSLTPTVTNTPTRTLTPSRTLIPSATFTRTLTLVPSLTYTKSNTPTKKPTKTATFTRTPTFTETITETPTETLIPDTPTNTVYAPPPSNTPRPTAKPIGG